MNDTSRQVTDYMGKLVVFLCHQRIAGNDSVIFVTTSG